MISSSIENRNDLRVIKTARKVDEINMYARDGYLPLIKKVVPGDNIRSKYRVSQNRATGVICVDGDFRSSPGAGEWDIVIDFTDYYPHRFESPFAAYIIPKDITKGERVFVEDLIEDFVGATWNQGDVYRLESCDAIWTGVDLEIQYDPDVCRSDFVG